MASAMKIMTATCKPVWRPPEVRETTEERENSLIWAGSSRRRSVPTNANKPPRKSVKVPRVTFRDGNRKVETQIALMIPKNAPTAMAKSAAIIKGHSKSIFVSTTVVMYIDATAVAETDTSIQTEIKTVSSPSANRPITTELRAIPNRWARVKNWGARSPKISATTMTTMSSIISRMANMRLIMRQLLY